MSYLVLARKWRPKTFSEVTGQAHIVQALENALSSGRVHHAFLFAGTRGVGKTTIARILAKALNCESGISPDPCGICSSCLAVDEGRFVDLIEVDAASRTKVDDTRDLLDNVQYTPAVGRFKVYLIDEVHMLSRQSFNALLKTLEEPPPHVKFLFATTDPQKLPVTVLSRCLQFNLKRLTTKQIVGRMTEICAAEKLEAEPAALVRLGRAAAGSMRDGLSLLDQALAYGAEKLLDNDVAEMLGSMDQHRIVELLEVLASGDGAHLIQTIRELDELAPDYETVLDELATALQRIAVIQVAGIEAAEEEDEVEALAALAGSIGADLIQLLYQIAVTSRRDISLAPDPRLGFEMALLRMLAFTPSESLAASGAAGGKPAGQPAQSKATAVPVPAKTTRSQAKPPVKKPQQHVAASGDVPQVPAKADESSAQARNPSSLEGPSDWLGFVANLPLGGAVRQLAESSAMTSLSPFELHLCVHRSNEHFMTDNLKGRLVTAIQQQLGSDINVQFSVTDKSLDSIAARAAEQARLGRDQARDAIDSDPGVQQLVDVFGAEVVPDSIQSVERGKTAD